MFLPKFWLIFNFIYLIGGFSLVLVDKSHFYSRKILLYWNIISILFLSLFSFHLDIANYQYDDIVRISNEISMVPSVGLSGLLDLYSNNPLTALFYYFVFLLGDTRFASFFGVLISNLCLVTAAYIFSCKNNIHSINFFIATWSLLLLNNYSGAAFNIRFTTALSMIMLGIEMQNDRNIYIPSLLLFISAIAFHSGVLPVVLIYIAVFVLKKKYYYIIIPVLIYSVFISFFIDLANRSGIQFFIGMADKASSYFIEGVDFDQQMDINQWIIRYYWFIFSCFIGIEVFRLIRNNIYIENYFLICVIFFALGALPLGFTAFSRYTSVALRFSVFPVLLLTNNFFVKENKSFDLNIKGINACIVCIINLLFICSYFCFQYLNLFKGYYFTNIPSFSFQF